MTIPTPTDRRREKFCYRMHHQLPPPRAQRQPRHRRVHLRQVPKSIEIKSQLRAEGLPRYHRHTINTQFRSAQSGTEDRVSDEHDRHETRRNRESYKRGRNMSAMPSRAGNAHARNGAGAAAMGRMSQISPNGTRRVQVTNTIRRYVYSLFQLCSHRRHPGCPCALYFRMRYV